MIKILASLILLSLIHARDYANTGYWSHDLSDGTTLGERVNEVSVGYANYSEILYKGRCDLRNAVDMWEQSPSHNAVLENPQNNYMAMLMIADPHNEGNCYIVGTFYGKIDE